MFALQGFQEACEKGPLINQKMTGIRVRLIDGMHHIVDSSDLAFRLAAKGAYQEGMYCNMGITCACYECHMGTIWLSHAYCVQPRRYVLSHIGITHAL